MSALLRECLIAWQEKPEEPVWSVIAFDGVLTETHSGASVVTSYPVDSGFMVSDHTIRQNRVFELDTITSKLSMTVATRRQSFEDAYNEILAAVAEEKALIAEQTGLEDTSPVPLSYDQSVKYGRAYYNNDPGIFEILPESWELERDTVTDGPISPRLVGQASLSKVEEAVRIIDKLCAAGTLVHVSTLRAIRTNCVIRNYSVSNNVSNSYSAPIKLTLEQLNIVIVNRATGQTSTNETGAEGVVDGQSRVRSVDGSTASFQTRISTRAPQDIIRQRRSSSEELPDEFYALEHQEVPFSSKFDTQFLYEGIEYNLGMVRYNPSLELWITSLSWREAGVTHTINSLPLASGVNQIQQYGSKLPSLVVVDNTSASQDPKKTKDMRLYIVLEFEKYFLEEVE